MKGNTMPTIHNRRGLGLMLWPDGEVTAFATFAEAEIELARLCLALGLAGAIAEAY